MIRFLQTPGPMKKIILGGLLLIICAAMVITLVPGGIGSSFGLGGPGKGVVATVGSESVTTLEVQRQARQMLRRQFPQGSAQSSFLLPFFTGQAAEGLINEKMMVVEAERLGIRATDQELRDELQHGELASMLFPGGNFIGQEAYQQFAQRNDLTVPQFEALEKNFILIRKLRGLIAGSASVTDAEVRQEFERRNTKVKFDYAVLRKDDLLKAIHPSEAELKAFYERNQASYNNSIPEKRRLRYVLVDTEKVQAQTPVTRADLLTYYDQHRDEFRVAEQVNVRQIVIKTPLPGADGKVDPKGVEEARKKAEEVAKQLKAGAKFEDLAKKSSDDPSAKNGGLLGWMQPGQFPASQVQQAARSLGKGETSDAIDAGYAFVILHIDDKQDAHVKTLDEVKGQIEPIIKQQKAARATDSLASTLLTQARAKGLEQAAAAQGMQAVTTSFVSRTDSLPGIGSSPQFMDAVFNAGEKSPPDQAQVNQGYAVFEVLEIKPAATPSFEEIRSRVESEFKNERVTALLSQKTQELSDRAKAGHNLRQAAKELGATMKTSELVLPDAQVPDIGSLSGGASVAFTMKPGEISGPIESGGTGAVLALLERQQPAEQDFAVQKDQIRDSLLQAKQSQLFGLFVANVREQMQKSGKLKINEQEMKSLTRPQGGEEGE